MLIEMNNAQVGSSMNIVHAFSGHVVGAELVHDVLLVAVLVVVLLHDGHDLLHAVIYTKKLSFIFQKRVLFFFGFFAERSYYGL